MDNFVEPFAGSLAVLLARPSGHKRRAETINDADKFLANFWRALQAAPEEVARWADYPVVETDLHARHAWLVQIGMKQLEKLDADPDFYDAKIAGWWLWGINSWIGSGWCSGNGPWKVVDGQLTKIGSNGVNRQLPHLGNPGRGINRKLPHLGNAGRGINRQLPHILLDYMYALSNRLRKVRVCCGDWSRIVTDGALSYGSSIGIFLDPPYSDDRRMQNLYNEDSNTLSKYVREWAIQHGDNQRFRIVLAGYEDEHEMPNSWRIHAYSANRSYGSNKNPTSQNNENRHKERLWFSPYCLNPEPKLFQ